MIRSVCFIFTLVVVYSFNWYSLMPSDDLLTLEEAAKSGKISYSINGNGDHSGPCLKMKVENLSGRKINLKIPAGSSFDPEDESMQTIFVINDQLLSLEKGTKRAIDVSGFCCESGDACPSDGIGFKLGKPKKEKLVELAAFLNGKKFDDNILQNAVWCVSDNNNVSNIYADDRSKVEPLREFICKLTGQKNTWFSTANEISVDENRQIVQQPTIVTGAIALKTEGATKITAEIRRGDNSVVMKMPTNMDIPGAMKFEYDFTLRVRGWEKGDYQVVVFSGTNEILKQPFTI